MRGSHHASYFENLLASAGCDMDVYVRVTDTGFEVEDLPILFETDGYDGFWASHNQDNRTD